MNFRRVIVLVVIGFGLTSILGIGVWIGASVTAQPDREIGRAENHADGQTNWLNAVFSTEALPTCESKEVTETLEQMVDGKLYDDMGRRMIGFRVTYPQQASYDRHSGTRSCRAEIQHNDYRQVVEYSVEWYSERHDRFLVRVL